MRTISNTTFIYFSTCDENSLKLSELMYKLTKWDTVFVFELKIDDFIRNFLYITMTKWPKCVLNNFLRIFEKRLKDIFLQNWNIEKDNMSDFRLFKRITQSFVFEKYLNISNKTFRISITNTQPGIMIANILPHQLTVYSKKLIHFYSFSA